MANLPFGILSICNTRFFVPAGGPPRRAAEETRMNDYMIAALVLLLVLFCKSAIDEVTEAIEKSNKRDDQ